jgi:Na+/melibiose symporter-like transporter
MGFWTVGSVGGNFLAAIVASLTLFVFHSWRSQYAIAGGVGMVVFLVCLIGLRELSPGLRAQVMNSLRDKGLVEARAGRIDIEATLRHPWRQILRTRLLINALGINLFLLIYVVARSFFVIYLSTSFNFPLAQANGMVSVFFLVILISSILVGFISDKMRVRKPFMLIGSSSLVIVTLLFTSRTGQLTSDALITVLLGLIGLCISITFVPWVAAYTETVEDINPALVATGIAVEVFISRWVAIIAILALPVVIGNGQGWQVWWWVCIAGQIMFLPTILTISGQWNPARARATAEAHE